MEYNIVTVNLTRKEAETLLEAFTNWMDTGKEAWTEDGKAKNISYRAIIFKLEDSIKGG